ncbi:MAG: TRAP transporter fused permease subunit [Pseudomonadota bacterium]
MSSDADFETATKSRDLADIAAQPEQGAHLRSVALIAFCWSAFQLWFASPFNVGVISDVPARAVHLCFAITLCFLLFRARPGSRRESATPLDLLLLSLGALATLYLWLAYKDGWFTDLLTGIFGLFGVAPARDGLDLALTERPGIPLKLAAGETIIPFEFIIGILGIGALLEATRRSIGLPLVIVCLLFFLYSIFGQSMPELISHKGVSPERLVAYHWFDGEAIFGMALDVSLSPIFLFVLFGALLDRAGAGHYFIQLAFALVGRFRGGPAKASILASGMTGMISGSSVANTVTTGNFTIPLMKKSGMPATKAGAIEVAASVNGQIMPPIMGAAAFVMAEFIGISYFDVIYHAFLPAVIAYLALLYLSHLEALKLGMTPMDESEIPRVGPTFRSGAHFLIPIALLIYLMLVERLTPDTSVFYAILLLIAIIIGQRFLSPHFDGTAQDRLKGAMRDVFNGFVAGARNMAGVAVAIGAAGIVVGAVSSTGLSNALVGFVEAISGGNIIILLIMTAVLCLLLGLGLPTTANYLVVASILAPVVLEVGASSGLVVPLIVIHLFVFYFGLMADVTPPVGLAAYAASAISRADPIATGAQAFMYEIRTAILPFVFVFNTQLLLIGIDNVFEGILVFVSSLLAILCFASLTQRWIFTRLSLAEVAPLILAMTLLFRPDLYLDGVSPPYRAVPLSETGIAATDLADGEDVRIRIVRDTPYGERRRVAVLTPEELGGVLSAESLGATIAPEGEGWIISETRFLGLAETKGLQPFDQVRDVRIARPDRPTRHWFTLLGFMVLGGVLWNQRRRMQADAVKALA